MVVLNIIFCRNFNQYVEAHKIDNQSGDSFIAGHRDNYIFIFIAFVLQFAVFVGLDLFITRLIVTLLI